jgi:hypothetical protein
MSSAVGADVESICNKCGDVWHVVVAKVGDQIAKVQCKECGSYHRHKPPGGSPGSKSSSGARAASRPAGIVVPQGKKPMVEADLSRPVRGYAIRETYAPGDRIAHPTFGTGVVESLPAPGKITVMFDSGRKLLVHGRGAA